MGNLHSWMVYQGKSQSQVDDLGGITPISGNPHLTVDHLPASLTWHHGSRFHDSLACQDAVVPSSFESLRP